MALNQQSPANALSGERGDNVATLPITDSTTLTAGDFLELSSGKLVKSTTALSIDLVGVAATTKTAGVYSETGQQDYMGVITEGLVIVKGLVEGSGGTYTTALAVGSKVSFHYDATAGYGQFVVASEEATVGTVVEGSVAASGDTDDEYDYVVVQLDFESSGGTGEAPSSFQKNTKFTGAKRLQFRDTALYIYSSADGQLDIVADTTVALSGAVTMDSTLTLSGGKLNLYPIGSAAASASGLLMGVGTTANPATTSTADAKFVEIRAQSTATSGDNRLLYLRYDLDGAGASGECIRAFCELGAAVATARGAHISLEVNSADYPSGLGVGVDAQLLFESGATGGGTLAALQAEMYGASGATIGSAVASFLRFSNNGASSTETDDIDDNAFLMHLDGFTIGDNHVIGAAGSAPDLADLTHGIKIRVGSTSYWLVVSDQNPTSW